MEWVGVEIGKRFFRTALLSKKRGSIAIESLIETANVKPLDHPLQKKRIVSGLDLSNILLKKSLITLKKLRDVKKALPFQMQTLTSIPTEEVLFSPQFVSHSPEGFHFLYFISTKEHVQEHLKKLSYFSLDPDLVSAYPIALARFAQFLFPNHSSLYHLHFEQERIIFLFIENHLPSRAISLHMEEDEKKEKEAIYLFDAHPTLKAKMSHAFASFRTEPLPLLFTGEKELFCKSEQAVLSTFSQYISYLLSAPEKEGRFAIPIGLALDGYSSSPVSFRQKTFLPSKQLSVLGKKIFFFLLFLLLFSFSLTMGGEFFFKKRKAFLDKKWKELCVAEKIEAKTLLSLEKILQKESKDFPYYSRTPGVMHTLSWLENHPIFGKREEKKPLFELNDFRYELLEMPTLQEPQKPYRIRVEMEFATYSSFWASKFHESLLEEENYIEKNEVEWEPIAENRYKASFYLKPLSLKELYDANHL